MPTWMWKMQFIQQMSRQPQQHITKEQHMTKKPQLKLSLLDPL
jgi:hypothetical protein